MTYQIHFYTDPNNPNTNSDFLQVRRWNEVEGLVREWADRNGFRFLTYAEQKKLQVMK